MHDPNHFTFARKCPGYYPEPDASIGDWFAGIFAGLLFAAIVGCFVAGMVL